MTCKCKGYVDISGKVCNKCKARLRRSSLCRRLFCQKCNEYKD